MKFHCLCMSPAIDACVTLPEAPRGDGEIFKNLADAENVGGKGINVARWLAIRGAEVSCGGILGRDNAAVFEKELARYGIRDRFLRVDGSTRRNEMITWPGGSFKLNRSAFPDLPQEACVGAGDLGGFDELGPGDVVIISGSLPQNFLPSFYAMIVLACRGLGLTSVLDASGSALQYGFEARPDVIKPNAEECEALVGFVPRTPDDFLRATRMLKKKVKHAIISDGANGCWFDGEFVAAPRVDAVDTTAAGDTLLAEYCYQRFSEASPDYRFAVAAGSAAVEMPGSNPPSPERVRGLV